MMMNNNNNNNNQKQKTNIFTVRSKPQSTSLRASNAIQILNLIASILINVTTFRLFHLISIYLEGRSNGHNGSSNFDGDSDSDSDSKDMMKMWQNAHNVGIGTGIDIDIGKRMLYTLQSPSSSWEMKLLVLLYNVITMVQLLSWMRGSNNNNNFISMTNNKSSPSVRRRQTQNVCQVEILPLGIQIHEFTYTQHVLSSDTSQKMNDEKKHEIRNEKVQFIPMENIVDIIVSEVILSYKVRNCVMFRVAKKKNNVTLTSAVGDNVGGNGTKLNMSCGDNIMASGDISLIPAFSTTMVEMTYKECFNVWQGISAALADHGI